MSYHNLSVDEILETIKVGSNDPYRTPDPLRYITDENYVDKVQDSYAKALDSIGLNLKDPSVSYMKYFNKSRTLLGLDPQRSGLSHVFFTRPDLNLGSEIVRRMVPYFDYVYQSSIGKAIMSLLQYPEPAGRPIRVEDKYKTTSPFDPLRSNLCTSVGAGKDPVLERFDTEADFAANQLSYGGGADGIGSIGEISVNFEDVIYSPIFIEHVLWFLYIHHLVKGTIRSHKVYELNRIIDYTCSIYVFRLAEDNKTIIRFGKYTGCFPIMVPMGTLKHSTEINSDDLKDFSITYAYNRYEPMEPEIFVDFNHISKKAAMNSGEWVTTGYADSVHMVPKPHTVPERKIEPIKPTEGWKSDHWSRHPFIVGNKLIFL